MNRIRASPQLNVLDGIVDYQVSDTFTYSDGTQTSNYGAIVSMYSEHEGWAEDRVFDFKGTVGPPFPIPSQTRSRTSSSHMRSRDDGGRRRLHMQATQPRLFLLSFSLLALMSARRRHILSWMSRFDCLLASLPRVFWAVVRYYFPTSKRPVAAPQSPFNYYDGRNYWNPPEGDRAGPE